MKKPGNEKYINETTFKEGNKASETWTLEKSLKFYNEALKLLKEDENIFYIGQLANMLNSYKEIFNYLHKKHKDNHPDFITIKKQINSIIETRTYIGALIGKLNPGVSIFGLKNNHNWTDKQLIHNINETVNFEVSKEANDSLNNIINEND